MSAPVPVLVHPSQFPQTVHRDLAESLQSRQINSKFLYDSIKQTQKWLALFQTYSTFVNDPACAAIYDRAFLETARSLNASRIHLLSLGCGGGQKDIALLRRLQEAGKAVSYSPCDVAPSMTLAAHVAVSAALPGIDSRPFVCDLATASNLAEELAHQVTLEAAPLVALFGVIPNFEPDVILPLLADILKLGGHLLLSANLVPSSDYTAGVRKILPLYDNELTRDWLFTFLSDLGVAPEDGKFVFSIRAAKAFPSLERVVADFVFLQSRNLQVGDNKFRFTAGEAIRLFFSYRYTAKLLESVLSPYGISISEQWIAPSEEEGAFLCSRK
jgi:SAM-dependent methyltransferase